MVSKARTSSLVASPLQHDGDIRYANFLGETYTVVSQSGGLQPGTQLAVFDLRASIQSKPDLVSISRFVSGTQLSPRGVVVPVSTELLKLDTQNPAVVNEVGVSR